MKLKTLILLLMLMPIMVMAQKSKPWNKPLYDAHPFHYGFAFGIGVLDFSVKPVPPVNDEFLYDSIYSVEGNAKPVFGANMVANLRLSPNWDLRFLPGLYFGQRNLTYLYSKDDEVISQTLKIESTIVQFPLLLKYRALRQNNYRPYVVFGGTYALDLAARKGTAYKSAGSSNETKARWLNTQDVLLECGVGCDYYLPFFKLSTELRFSYGLLNIAYDSNLAYTDVFDRLGTKMVTLVVYFE